MTGDMDYLLRVQVEDMAHFSRFVQDQLLHHPSVIDVKTSFSLERIKETTALPLLLSRRRSGAAQRKRAVHGRPFLFRSRSQAPTPRCLYAASAVGMNTRTSATRDAPGA